jgi:MtfA peptidase
MIFTWLRERRRRQLLEEPIPEDWLAYLDKNIPHYEYLSEEEQAVLRDDLRIFLAEKYWEGCGGLELTDEIQVTISAQASLLTLHLPQKYYPNVKSLFIYPGSYRAKRQVVGPGGVVTETMDERLGEAWQTGPVVLSWGNARDGGLNPSDGRSVVLHEFAHKLDMMNGRADGVPRLYDDEAYDRWEAVIEAEYNLLVEQSELGRATVLDDYGAQSPAEFFAVATEAFFERPRQLLRRHEGLYEVLRDYYGQDPAARLEARLADAMDDRHEPRRRRDTK